MHLKLRYVLPLIQIALAVVLLWQSQVWFEAVRHRFDMPGTAPHSLLLLAINAPITVLRVLWYRHMNYYMDMAILIAMIGILWYWVGLNVESLRTSGQVLALDRMPLRIAADLLLIALGFFFGFVYVHDELTHRELASAKFAVLHVWLRTPFRVTLTFFWISWPVALIFFFGRDLIHILRRNPASH
jgi:hypothetical protein